MNQDPTCLSEEYVAHLVHDLKTPILAIGGYAQRLEREKMGPLNDQQLGAVRQIIQLAERLEHDVSWVLKHAQLQKTLDQKLASQTVDLNQIIEQAESTIRPLLDEKELKLETRPADQTAQIEGDPSMIERAVTELIRNAIKHSPHGGWIEAALHRDDPYWVVSVSDQGPGLTREQIDKLFQSWEQVMAIDDRNLRGIGLGLANVRNMAEAHGGSVQVDSTPGRGSTFTIRLPAKPG
jgi:signal transduction histidine kinase